MRRAKKVFDDADDDWTVTKHRYNIYLCMYIYIYVYLYMYIYTCIYLCIFSHIYIYIYLCTYIYICMYVRVSIALLREQVAAVTILRYFTRLEQETRYRFYDRNKIKLIIFWMVRNDRGVCCKLYHVCCTYCLLGNELSTLMCICILHIILCVSSIYLSILGYFHDQLLYLDTRVMGYIFG